MAKKLNSMRLLEMQGVAYEALYFPDTVRSALGVAEHLGIEAAHVYKTLVVVLPTGKPALVLIAGDRELQLKPLAQALGVKKMRMATQQEAEAWTGLQVGGISALALQHRGFPVYVDAAVTALPTVLVSAGQRGCNVRLAVRDLLRVTDARVIDVTTPD